MVIPLVLFIAPGHALAGTFYTARHTPVGNGPNAVAIGDFNRDGKLDLAVTNSKDDDVSVLLGNLGSIPS